jgi:hypothetical protein
MHEAWEQSFRFRKDLGLPNQVCLFRHRQYSVVPIDPQWILVAEEMFAAEPGMWQVVVENFLAASSHYGFP